MITPATTGTTNTRAAVAMLRWDRSGSMAAPSPTERATPTSEPTSASAHLPIVVRIRSDGRGTRSVENLFRATGRL